MSLARSSGDSCRGKHAHLAHAGVQQHPGAGVTRRTSRTHIVDQHHHEPLEAPRRAARERPQGRPAVAPGEPERARHVAVAFAGMQPGLRARSPRAAQRVTHGEPQCRCQQRSLIEPASAAAQPMKRHGDSRVGAGGHVAAGFAHQRGERARERPALVVLEGVDDIAEAAFVRADGTGGGDKRGPAAAGRTTNRRCVQPSGCRDGRGLRRHGITACAADGRREPANGGPAGPAHGTGRRLVQRPAACGALGSDDDAEERVEEARDAARGLRRRDRACPRVRRCPRAARCRRTLVRRARRRGR